MARKAISKIPAEFWTEGARAAQLGCHLYVIQEDVGGPCKIGIARNAFWRRSDLQTGNWRPLALKAVYRTDDRRAALLAEAAVLTNFRAEHLSGEWLNVAPELLITFIDEEFASGAD